MKYKQITAVTMSLALAGAAQSATLTNGYTTGAGSQLLAANSGAGSILFADAAATGGSDVNVTGGVVSPFASVLLNGSSSWSVGETVSITGFAIPLVDGPTATGVFTFDIRQGAGGVGASGTSGLASLGTADATYTTGSGTAAYYVNFDTPVSFIADANSTSIVINWSSTGAIRYKKEGAPGAGRLPQVNYGNGNFVGGDDTVRVSVAGSVTPVPEPSSAALLSLGGLALVLRRKR
ncbi:MAG: PEP-CTERM sorting domain-containing protein [Akkermansiaceae bacterium]